MMMRATVPWRRSFRAAPTAAPTAVALPVVRAIRVLTVLAVGALVACGSPSSTPPVPSAEGATPSAAAPLRVAAAASLADVLRELEPVWRRSHDRPLELNLAGSNVLARQIEAAPAADVFLSADALWVDVLEAAGRVAADGRRVVAANRIVLVSRRDATVVLDAPEDLARAAYRHLAVADPEAVPAGRYARAHLEALEAPGGGSLWQAVRDRVVPALDVRAALALVESDPEIVGLVYSTDAATSERVVVRHVFEPVVPIRYVGAVVVDGDQAAARQFLDVLATPEAQAVLRRHGFEAAR